MDENNKINVIDPLEENFELFPIVKHIAFFLTGWLGLKIIALIVSRLTLLYYQSHNIDLSLEANIKYASAASVIMNVSSYLILVIALIAILGGKGIKVFLQQFKNENAIVDGLAYGGLLLLTGSAIGIICTVLRGGNGSVNDNESAIRFMTKMYPLPLIIMTGIFAPFCEELTYRLGLYNVLRRKNRWLAYVVCALVFAFIHFTIPDTNSETFKAELINELWNLPSYIVSGLVLCRAYEKHQNIATSIIAHAVNNFVAIFSTIASAALMVG